VAIGNFHAKLGKIAHTIQACGVPAMDAAKWLSALSGKERAKDAKWQIVTELVTM